MSVNLKKHVNPDFKFYGFVPKGEKKYRVIFDTDNDYFIIVDADGYECGNHIFTRANFAVDFIYNNDMNKESWIGTEFSKD